MFGGEGKSNRIYDISKYTISHVYVTDKLLLRYPRIPGEINAVRHVHIDVNHRLGRFRGKTGFESGVHQFVCLCHKVDFPLASMSD